MKIALLAPLSAPLSDSTKGGTETFVYSLEHELVARGHQVDTYTVASSQIAGNKIIVTEKAFKEEDIKLNARTARQIAFTEIAYSVKTFKILKDRLVGYDIIHNSQGDFYSLLEAAQTKKCVTTLHIPPDSLSLQLAQEIDATTIKNGHFIAISDSQKSNFTVPIFERIYNGIDVKQFTYQAKAKPYLAWLSRIDKNKGLLEAIAAAKATHTPLYYAGTPWDEEYYAQAERETDNQLITHIGHADSRMRDQFLGHARALLLPILWEEPFGLVFIEAMAAGTPVITYDRGAAREIILDGVTGYICPADDSKALQQAIKKIMTMPEPEYQEMREACRKHVEKHFTIARMVDDYEAVYARIASK